MPLLVAFLTTRLQNPHWVVSPGSLPGAHHSQAILTLGPVWPLLSTVWEWLCLDFLQCKERESFSAGGSRTTVGTTDSCPCDALNIVWERFVHYAELVWIIEPMAPQPVVPIQYVYRIKLKLKPLVNFSFILKCQLSQKEKKIRLLDTFKSHYTFPMLPVTARQPPGEPLWSRGRGMTMHRPRCYVT